MGKDGKERRVPLDPEVAGLSDENAQSTHPAELFLALNATITWVSGSMLSP